ncbi:hypothetical protein QBC33DRAFT_290822 [Phialemonium atrogriseum]|uniref:G domain-containing protein n=1 Tax=Phialemonium atrogriseum TaxID=1093897 RepID=A0AAJ0BPR1_9PEZI|nr:uncharacterized protein QBC33DRAFT_290822 [Phialemonium atrogriseum]KAK1762219.1 hypothetical protein QBC33DRAFT_290822 [Phialemonium atrogriseum]
METNNDLSTLFALPPSSEFLSQCPAFRLLVLGNAESTKVDIFSKIFGVTLPKNHLAAAFSPGHDITQELELDGQNSRLIIHTSPNFGSGDEQAYARVCDFLKARQSPSAAPADRIHCIWYCVACDEDRSVHGLEADFLAHLRSAAAPDTPPAVLVFTKYEELVGRARLEWSRDERRSGAASSVAVSHLIGDLASRRFEERIGGRWDGIVGGGGRVARVCVANDDGGDGGVGGGRSGFDALTGTTVAALKDWNAKLAFAAAQRNSPSISTQFAANIAAEYFTVDTGHARKRSGVEVGGILRDFFAKATQVFNLKDRDALLLAPHLLDSVLAAAFESRDELGLLQDALEGGDGDGGGAHQQPLIGLLSPHDRACLLAQALAQTALFFHGLATAQWAQGDPAVGLTEQSIGRELREMRLGTGRKSVIEVVEASPIFTQCFSRSEISELIVRAVEQTQEVGAGQNPISVSSELKDIPLTSVNDRGRDDLVLPCGMTIVPLT